MVELLKKKSKRCFEIKSFLVSKNHLQEKNNLLNFISSLKINYFLEMPIFLNEIKKWNLSFLPCFCSNKWIYKIKCK